MHLQQRPCSVIPHCSSQPHTATLQSCTSPAAVVLLVAGRRSLHGREAEVPPPAAEPGAPPVFELAAGAQPLHLQPVEEEGQAEGEAAVPPRDEVESLWS